MKHTDHFLITGKILMNWKNSISGWNSIVSSNVSLGSTNFVFPVPDASIIDNDKNLAIAIEFKTTLEDKRGALTALGQAIAYTQFYSIAYIVIPNNVNGFNLGDFMCRIFRDKKINQILPIGLIVYDIESNIPTLEYEVESTIKEVKLGKFGGTYWATFRDSYPDSIWRLLDIAYNIDNKTMRKKVIWDEFYYNYLLPIPESYWTDSELEDWLTYSKTYKWEENMPQLIGEKTIKILSDDISNSVIDLPRAKSKLGYRYFGQFKGDVPYQQLQKNIFNCMNNLSLFDDEYYITELGYKLHKVGKLHGSTSKVFKNTLAKILLLEGKHLDLIIEIDNISKDNLKQIRLGMIVVPRNTSEYSFILDCIKEEFEKNGKIKMNSNRKKTGKRKFLSAEIQLWNALGLINKDNSNKAYIEGMGFNFDWDEITNILIQR